MNNTKQTITILALSFLIGCAGHTPTISVNQNTTKDANLISLFSSNNEDEIGERANLYLSQINNSVELDTNNITDFVDDMFTLQNIIERTSQPNPVYEKLLIKNEKIIQNLKNGVKMLTMKYDSLAISLSGKKALDNWAISGSILGYYPESNTPEESVIIQALLLNHEMAGQKVQENQKGKYNIWALNRIEKSYQDINKKENKKKIVEVIIKELGAIDVNLLYPVTFNLYSQYFADLDISDKFEEMRKLADGISKEIKFQLWDNEIK